jgi:hypothetical protein
MQPDAIIGWAEQYIRHRDLIFRKIDTIEKDGNGLLIKNKDGSKEHVYPANELSNLNLPSLKSPVTLVIPNRQKNLKVLIEQWDDFASIADLKLIFFNPDSELQKTWIIKPAVHDRICDRASLKKGLVAMFETVDEIAVKPH